MVSTSIKINFFKVNTLPTKLYPNSWYMVESGDYTEAYITDKFGIPKGIANIELMEQIVGDYINLGLPYVKTIEQGANVTIDSTDPQHPIINAIIPPLNYVESLVEGDNISIDSTDPQHPIINTTIPTLDYVESIIPGTNISVDSTDPKNPKMHAS